MSLLRKRVSVKNSIVKIESVSNSSFGTGFVIDQNSEGVFILTCQHILDDVEIPVVEQVLAKVIAQDHFVDMAVLFVPKLTQAPLTLQSASCHHVNVEVIGFSHFNQNLTQKKHISATLYPDTVELHSNDDNRHFNVHKIKVDEGFHFERGNSGSPVICKKSNNVIAMISNKEGNNIGYAISIEHLKNIWKEMPKGLLEGKREKAKKETENKPNTTPIKKEKKRFLLKSILLFTLLSMGIYALSSLFSSNFSKTYVDQYQDLEVKLRSIEKIGKRITAVLVFQNNGKKNIKISFPYKAKALQMTDENGKIWKCTEIYSMNNEYSPATIILNDGRKIVSKHVFEATEESDGTDFYMNLKYIINGQTILFGFDHIEL